MPVKTLELMSTTDVIILGLLILLHIRMSIDQVYRKQDIDYLNEQHGHIVNILIEALKKKKP